MVLIGHDYEWFLLLPLPYSTMTDGVLLAKRPEGKAMAGLWEFPGGKVEPGETPEAALIRELDEEIGIKIAASDLKPLNFASFSYPTFHLLMPVFACCEWSGSPKPQENQDLSWVRPDDLLGYDAPEADIPIFELIAARRHLELI